MECNIQETQIIAEAIIHGIKLIMILATMVSLVYIFIRDC